MQTLILFPRNEFSPAKVDPEFETEYEAAKLVGFPLGLYSHEAAEAGTICDSIPLIRKSEAGPHSAILRGWMLNASRYAALYSQLDDHGIELCTSPIDYEQAHYLPNAYPFIEADTARSAWIEGDDPDEAWQLYEGFRNSDAIIKDWVKSAKRKWQEACFIPAGTSQARFHEIFHQFRQERGARFNRGVVLREYMPIVQRGGDIHGLPIMEETRLYFWQGQVLTSPDSRTPSPVDELDRWEVIARRFSSPFITIDVALLRDDSWKIVEVGDAGVSGLPMGYEAMRFYAGLWNRLGVEATA